MNKKNYNTMGKVVNLLGYCSNMIAQFCQSHNEDERFVLREEPRKKRATKRKRIEAIKTKSEEVKKKILCNLQTLLEHEGLEEYYKEATKKLCPSREKGDLQLILMQSKRDSSKILAKLTVPSMNITTVGSAKCHPDDAYVSLFGNAIALARAYKILKHNYLANTYNLKTPWDDLKKDWDKEITNWYKPKIWNKVKQADNQNLCPISLLDALSDENLIDVYKCAMERIKDPNGGIEIPRIDVKGSKTCVTMKLKKSGLLFTGCARCHPEDKYNGRIGRDLAIARAYLQLTKNEDWTYFKSKCFDTPKEAPFKPFGLDSMWVTQYNINEVVDILRMSSEKETLKRLLIEYGKLKAK